MEKFLNNKRTTLASVVVDSDTSIVVSNNANFGSTVGYRVKVNTEVMLVTSKTGGTTWTVTRGVEGTPILNHNAGTEVRHILTAGGLKQAFDDRYLTGTYASLPAAGIAGRKYYSTDSPYTLLDDGTNWLHFVNNMMVTPPVYGDYTWVNQSVGTATAAKGGIYMEATTDNGTAQNNMALVKTAPNTPYSIVVGYIPYWPFDPFGVFGLIWRNSGSGNYQIVRIGTSNGGSNFVQTYLENFNSPNSEQGNAFFRDFPMIGRPPVYVKIVDDGTNRKIYYGSNPFTFPLEYFSTARTTFVTPNQVGVFINNYNQAEACHFIHWKEGV